MRQKTSIDKAFGFPVSARRSTGSRASWALLLLIGLLAIVATYSYTASNTVGNAPAAGEGESAAVSGYTASNIVWGLDASSPDSIHQVTFTLTTVTASTSAYAGADNGTTIDWSNQCSQGTITSGSATETCTFSTEPSTSGTMKLAVSATG